MSGPVITPTKGESLFIARRRAGINQVEAAEKHGVHVDIYRDWETDKRVKDQPWQRLGNLKINEVCVLHRRRAGLTQRQLAATLGCTRLWINQMEGGIVPADRLRAHWGF